MHGIRNCKKGFKWHAIVLDTCHAIQKLLPRYVYIPKDERLHEIVDGFDAWWGFPQTAGAIDGTHIPILRPSGDIGSDYYNRKGFYSIVMQALVDYRGIFLDIIILGVARKSARCTGFLQFIALC